MANVKEYYPGATAGNPINNSTDSVNAAVANTATTATVGTTIDDQNSVNMLSVWTSDANAYAAVSPKDANTLYFVT